MRYFLLILLASCATKPERFRKRITDYKEGCYFGMQLVDLGRMDRESAETYVYEYCSEAAVRYIEGLSNP